MALLCLVLVLGLYGCYLVVELALMVTKVLVRLEGLRDVAIARRSRAYRPLCLLAYTFVSCALWRFSFLLARFI